MKNVRFGIIGLGGISRRFARVLKTAEGVELVAVASKEMARSENFAKEFHATKAYEGYQALVNDPEVDVVYIGLIHNLHYEVAKLCMENGKGVLCEKPLVLTKKEAKSLAQISKDNQVLLMEAMWSRFIPTTLKAKEWIDQGKIGQVKLINASFCFNFPYDPKHRLYNPELAGGSLYDAGVYPIEFASGMLGQYPSEVTSVATIGPTGVDEYVAMSFAYKNGALANLSCGLTAETNRDGKVFGSKGHIIVYDFLNTKKCERYNVSNELEESFECEFEDGFIFEIKHFVQLFRDGKIESSIIPHKENIATSGVFEDLIQQWR